MEGGGSLKSGRHDALLPNAWNSELRGNCLVKRSRYSGSETKRSRISTRRQQDALWREILDEVEKSGKGVLILMDEFLMWAQTQLSRPNWNEQGARAVLVDG